MPKLLRTNTAENIAGLFLEGVHYDTNLEAAVLGAILLEKDGFARTLNLIEPEHFYKREHASVYSAIVGMYAEGQAIDAITVCHQLRKNGIVEMEGQNPYYFLAMLMMDVVTGAHIEQWCLILSELHLEREMSIIRHEAGKGDGDTVEKALAIQELIKKALTKKGSDDWRDMSQVMLALDAHRGKVKGMDMLGVSTGIRTLDKITAGLQPTQLIVIAARPSVGKSAFATGLAVATARTGKQVGIVSLEMPEEQIGGRISSIYTDIEFWRIYRNKHTDAREEQMFLDAVPGIATLPISISDKTSVSGSAIRAKAEKLQRRKGGLDLLIIDYLQLIESETKSGDNREREIAKLSRSLKLMAMDLKIPVVILCQLNRDSEKEGKSKRPKMSQIRESGAIEQDADIVMLLDYPFKRGETTDESGNSTEKKAHIIVEKNRNGETADVVVTFEPELMKFYEPDPFGPVFDNPNSNGIQAAGRKAIDFTQPKSEQEDLPF